MINALKEWPGGALRFSRSLQAVPFEAALGLASIWSGFAAIFNATLAARMFNDTLPIQLAMCFNIVYVVAGVTLLMGIGWSYRNVEASGLIILIAVLFTRTATVWAGYGFNSVTSANFTQATIFSVASFVRLRTLLKGWSVVLFREARVIGSLEELKSGPRS